MPKIAEPGGTRDKTAQELSDEAQDASDSAAQLPIDRAADPTFFQHAGRWFQGTTQTMAVANRHRIWQKDFEANPANDFSGQNRRIKDADGSNWTIPGNASFNSFYGSCASANNHYEDIDSA